MQFPPCRIIWTNEWGKSILPTHKHCWGKKMESVSLSGTSRCWAALPDHIWISSAMHLQGEQCPWDCQAVMDVRVKGSWWIYGARANHLRSTLYITAPAFTEHPCCSVLLLKWSWEVSVVLHPLPGWELVRSGRWWIKFWDEIRQGEVKDVPQAALGHSEPPGCNQTCFKSCKNTATPGSESICLTGRLILSRMVPWAGIYSSLRNSFDKMKPSLHPISSYECVPPACTPFKHPWGEQINLTNGYVPLMASLERKLNIINSC